MEKNIPITGGSGFIGSNLVAALLKDKRVGKIQFSRYFQSSKYVGLSPTGKGRRWPQEYFGVASFPEK